MTYFWAISLDDDLFLDYQRRSKQRSRVRDGESVRAREGGLGLAIRSLGGVEKTHLLDLYLGGVAWAFR